MSLTENLDSSIGEVVTLQVGRYANFVGTHYWNFQDELSQLLQRGGLVEEFQAAAMYRWTDTGRGSREATPRLLMFDTNDGLGFMHPLGSLVGNRNKAGAPPSAASGTWVGNINTVYQQAPARNAFVRFLENEEAEDADGGYGEGGVDDVTGSQGGGGGASGGGFQYVSSSKRLRAHPFGLDDSVVTWADYLKAYTHPSTFQKLPFRDVSTDFGSFGSGSRDAATSGGPIGLEEFERYSDALRAQLEDCDAVQGLNVITDICGGWGGLSYSLMAEFANECRHVPVSCFAVQRQLSQQQELSLLQEQQRGTANGRDYTRSCINTALFLSANQEVTSLTALLDAAATVAVSPHHLAVNRYKSFHTSAVLAAAIEVATSRYRFFNGGGGGNGASDGDVMQRVKFTMSDWVNGCKSSDGFGSCGGSYRECDRKFASLSMCLPYVHPDADERMFRRDVISSSRGSGGGGLSAVMSSLAPSNIIGGVSSTLRSTIGSTGTSVGGSARRLFSTSLVSRGLSLNRRTQVDVLRTAAYEMLTCQNVHDTHPAMSGPTAAMEAAAMTSHFSPFAMHSPLPIPLSFPLIFRDSVGERGEVRDSGGGGGDGRHRVMCDEVSVLTAVEQSSRLYPFLQAAVDGLKLNSPLVNLELEKTRLQQDDAVEIKETLMQIADMYAPISGGS